MDYPLAIQHRGPASKLWPERNAQAGIVLHSLEGYVPYALQEIDDEAIALSWHFTVAADGLVYQHYDLWESPWHAGTKAANIRLIGIEHEGVAGVPLTDIQRNASVALVQWIADESGLVLSRDAATRTLWEHNEIPGAQTTCPNGRIPWEAYTMPTYGPNQSKDLDLTVVMPNVETVAVGFEPPSQQWPKGRDVYEVRVSRL